MRVSTWDILKDREEATSLRSFMGDELTEIPTCSIEFFWAHAVRARGSDGHQNVLSLIGNSHMLENR